MSPIDGLNGACDSSVQELTNRLPLIRVAASGANADEKVLVDSATQGQLSGCQPEGLKVKLGDERVVRQRPNITHRYRAPALDTRSRRLNVSGHPIGNFDVVIQKQEIDCRASGAVNADLNSLSPAISRLGLIISAFLKRTRSSSHRNVHASSLIGSQKPGPLCHALIARDRRTDPLVPDLGIIARRQLTPHGAPIRGRQAVVEPAPYLEAMAGDRCAIVRSPASVPGQAERGLEVEYVLLKDPIKLDTCASDTAGPMIALAKPS